MARIRGCNGKHRRNTSHEKDKGEDQETETCRLSESESADSGDDDGNQNRGLVQYVPREIELDN